MLSERQPTRMQQHVTAQCVDGVRRSSASVWVHCRRELLNFVPNWLARFVFRVLLSWVQSQSQDRPSSQEASHYAHPRPVQGV